MPSQVVPLSQRSGIVEWCENTVPLGEYLIGVRGIGGAHTRYHPTDWSAAECRKKMTVSCICIYALKHCYNHKYADIYTCFWHALYTFSNRVSNCVVRNFDVILLKLNKKSLQIYITIS